MRKPKISERVIEGLIKLDFAYYRFVSKIIDLVIKNKAVFLLLVITYIISLFFSSLEIISEIIASLFITLAFLLFILISYCIALDGIFNPLKLEKGSKDKVLRILQDITEVILKGLYRLFSTIIFAILILIIIGIPTLIVTFPLKNSGTIFLNTYTLIIDILAILIGIVFGILYFVLYFFPNRKTKRKVIKKFDNYKCI